MDRKIKTSVTSGGWLAGGGLLSGLGALFGASCCVLPVLLAQAGIGAALIAQIGALASVKPYLLAATTLLVVAGFVAAYRGGRRPPRRVLIMLCAAAALIAITLALPYFEPALLRMIRS